MLNNLRKKIDLLDNRILDLLNQRAKEVIKISKLKKENNLGIYVPAREASILNRLKKMNKGPLDSEDVGMLFSEMLSVFRSFRSVLTVAYLGPQGTFTHLAAIKKFGKKPGFVPGDSISDVFDKVERGESDYGVVPIENSIEGVVNYTLDMFFSSSLKICSEITMNISHALLVATGVKEIKRIYSNPQVLAQCRTWILRSYPKAELVPTVSTAKAAQQAKSDRNGACIGNKILAGLYGLKIAAFSIEDSSYNITRFLVIARNDSSLSDSGKTSILFSIKDKVGALHDVLYTFKKNGINLTKIESRPSKKKPWDYYFFVDCEGYKSPLFLQKALKELEKMCVFVKVLGSYPKES